MTWRIIVTQRLTPPARDLAYYYSRYVVTILTTILPVKSRLSHLRILFNANCELCETSEETVPHLFLKCRVMKPVRNLIKYIVTEKAKSNLANFFLVFEQGDEHEVAYNITILSEINLVIWKKRNKKYFEKLTVTSLDILETFKIALNDVILADKINLSVENFKLKCVGSPYPSL